MTPRYLPAFAALNAFLALCFGTFAAHMIQNPQAREWIMTGVIYQLPHVAAVFGLLGWRNTAMVRGGAWALSIGSFIFAVDLDLLALGLPHRIALFAPLGGALMICGWVWIATAAFAGPRADRVLGGTAVPSRHSRETGNPSPAGSSGDGFPVSQE